MTNSRNNDEIEVAPGFRCPQCSEGRVDYLVWINDDEVQCQNCGTNYDPNRPEDDDHRSARDG